MPKRWKKEEITYLRRYAKKRTLLELAERFRIDADAIENKLSELELQTIDGMGRLNLAEDPVVKIYEKGLKAVYARKWAEARKLFDRVVAEGDMPDLVHRAEQYLAVVERESSAASDPRDPYLKAVLEYNNGNLEFAEAACTREGRLTSDERYAYLGAAVASLREDYEVAIERLQVAVDLNPRNLIQARQDSDFAGLRDLSEFAEIDG